jgi:hypothetical protein
MPAADDLEIWFERGVTDGLPVVPPSRGRVDAMLAATGRAATELVAEVPPNFGRATVEKLAVNAVMAGCRPEYFPVVLAVVEAACDPAFNLHGQSGTTNAASPLIILNGPVRGRLGVNCAAGVFGPGFRANATIGRALRLVMINLGGTRAGQISMSTMGHPGRYTYCIGEHEEVSPWEPLHVERGFAASDSTVTLFSGESPFMVNDHLSRSASQLAGTFAAEGWSKAQLRAFLHETVRRPAGELVAGPDGAETGRLKNLLDGRTPAERIPKFPSPEEIVVVVAGGTAGRFSAVVPGWMGGEMGSRPVTRRIAVG